MTVTDAASAGAAGPPPAGLAAIGVIVPVRDEEILLGASLHALLAAMSLPVVSELPVRVALVLDRCADRSGEIAAGFARRLRAGPRDHRLTVIESRAGNVGSARHAGAGAVLEDLDGIGPERIWLATTDADSRVPRQWLAHQAAQRAGRVEAWAGTVKVEDWTERAARCRPRFTTTTRGPPAGGATCTAPTWASAPPPTSRRAGSPHAHRRGSRAVAPPRRHRRPPGPRRHLPRDDQCPPPGPGAAGFRRRPRPVGAGTRRGSHEGRSTSPRRRPAGAGRLRPCPS